MARKRDYKAEYAKRIARGIAGGKSRQEARGHTRIAKAIDLSDTRLAKARELEAKGYSRTRAAKEAHISTERYAATHRRGFMPQPYHAIFVAKGQGVVEVNLNPSDWKIVGDYLYAVKAVNKNGGQDTSALEPFDGMVVTDVGGEIYELETDWKALKTDDVIDQLQITGSPLAEHTT